MIKESGVASFSRREISFRFFESIILYYIFKANQVYETINPKEKNNIYIEGGEKKKWNLKNLLFNEVIILKVENEEKMNFNIVSYHGPNFILFKKSLNKNIHSFEKIISERYKEKQKNDPYADFLQIYEDVDAKGKKYDMILNYKFEYIVILNNTRFSLKELWTYDQFLKAKGILYKMQDQIRKFCIKQHESKSIITTNEFFEISFVEFLKANHIYAKEHFPIYKRIFIKNNLFGEWGNVRELFDEMFFILVKQHDSQLSFEIIDKISSRKDEEILKEFSDDISLLSFWQKSKGTIEFIKDASASKFDGYLVVEQIEIKICSDYLNFKRNQDQRSIRIPFDQNMSFFKNYIVIKNGSLYINGIEKNTSNESISISFIILFNNLEKGLNEMAKYSDSLKILEHFAQEIKNTNLAFVDMYGDI